MTELFNAHAKRIFDDVQKLIRQGYYIWHWWDDPIRPQDKCVTIGMKTFVLRR